MQRVVIEVPDHMSDCPEPNKMAMNWAQVTQKKQQQTQVHVSTIYFYIQAYISTVWQLYWISHTKSLNRS